MKFVHDFKVNFFNLLNEIKLHKNDFLICLLTFLLFSYSCFSFGLMSIVLVFFVTIVTLLNYRNIYERFKKDQIITFVFLVCWLLVLSSTIIYSENRVYGFKLVQRYLNIVIIAFTFIFVLPYKILNKTNILYLGFILSNIVFTLIIYYKAIKVIEVSCYPQIYYSSYLEKIMFVLKKPNHIIFSCFESEYKHSFFIHRVYNSMSFLFSIILIIELIFLKEFKKKIGYVIFGIFGIFGIFWFLFLIYYQFSIVNVFLTVILVPLFLLIKIKSKNIIVKKTIPVSLTIIFLLLIIVGYNKSTVVKNQIDPAINLIKQVVTGNTSGKIDERYEINIASKSLIFEKPIFGYGIGDVQDKLNGFYEQKMNENKVYKKVFENKLNSHNNFAFFALAGGVVVFGLFLFSQLYLFRVSILDRNIVYLFFILIISCNLMFENILSRIHGVIFYSLFNSLFLTKYIYKRKC